MVVAENIKRIVQYFEVEENLYHKEIGLITDLNNEEMTSVLEYLETEMPGVSIMHLKSNTMKKRLCFPSEHDLIIQLPEGILQARQGTFKYNFQSRLKNIFGTFEVELKIMDNHVTSGQEQFFTTSIGG